MPRRRRSVLVTKRSSPTSCTRSPIASVSALPAVPVLLVHAVLDRHDRVAGGHVGPVVGQLLGGERAALVLEHVGAVLEDLAGGRVERDGHVVAGRGSRPPRCPRSASRAPPRSSRGRARSRPRRPPPWRGRGRGASRFSAWKTSAPDAQPLGEARRPHRHDHELLEVDLVVGVRAAVQHVHHRHRAARAPPRRRGSARAAARPRPRRPWPRPATRPGSRWRRAGPCSACRPARSSRGRAPAWSAASRPLHRLGQLAVHVRDRLGHALAGPGVAAVAQLHCLELAGGGARRARPRARRRRTAGARRPRPSGCRGESRIWRAWTCLDARSLCLHLVSVIDQPPGAGPARDPRRRRRASRTAASSRSPGPSPALKSCPALGARLRIFFA